jgi:hypothetical protein
VRWISSLSFVEEPGLPKEVEGVEGRRRDFEEALMREITPEEEVLDQISVSAR